jgi:hypothetical protein
VKTGASLFATGPAADAFRDCGSGLEDSWIITFFMFFSLKIHGLISVILWYGYLIAEPVY